MVRKSFKWYAGGFWLPHIHLNRSYRDHLFRFLFKDKRDLLELYNALNGSDYRDPNALEIVTLEDVIFLKMKNDLSFIIGDRLNLYEHQSTKNPNMPLRGFLYFARQYEGLVAAGKRSLYGNAMVPLPTPKYVVFYNGTEELEDETTLYLSDTFSEGRGSGCLECRCMLLNINRGHNRGLLEKCRRLEEYSEFVSRIYDALSKGMSLKRAIETAMDSCIEEGILKDVLIRQKTEVMHMLLTEFDEKKYKRSVYQDGYEDGVREGEISGFTKGEASGFTKGEASGLRKGQAQGREDALRDLARKKASQGKDVAIIAAELETDVETVERLLKEEC